MANEIQEFFLGQNEQEIFMQPASMIKFTEQRHSNGSLSVNNNTIERIRGNLPTKDYSEEINILKSQLPQKALDILKELGTVIRVFDKFLSKN